MDTMRWRHGDTNPVSAAVDAEMVIEINDLVWQDTNDAKPASRMTPPPEVMGTGEAAGRLVSPPPCLQDMFAEKFLGVAMQRSRSGDTAPIVVATTGVFEFDCPDGTFELGDLVGVKVGNVQFGPDDPGKAELRNQQVDSVAASRYAIGRVAMRQASAVTSVLVDVRSSVMTGGVYDHRS